MTFGESISTCFSKYANFDGRATRSEFWWWVLFAFLGSAACSVLSPKISGVFSLVTFLPYIGVTARRLHDTDRTGWLQLIIFIPLIGLILLIVWCVQEGVEPNRFGSAATATQS